MQSSSMSAGGESSSEQLASPQIIAHEEDLAWKEYDDALDKARHGPGSRDYDAVQRAPTALSIMRRDRSGSEDVLTARRAVLERREERMGEGNNISSRFPRLTPGAPYSSGGEGRLNPSLMLHRHPAEYMADRARWEQEQAYDNAEYHQYYYEHDPYYGNYGYGFRDYDRGASSRLGNHAPMPSFLGDAYRRHQEMGYGAAEMSMIKDRYLPSAKGGGYRDPISLSDHGPSGGRGVGAAPSVPNLNRPLRQVSQGSATVQQRATQPVPNVSPQRGVVNNGRAYQEMDWKHDRLWREDNHTQTANLDVVNPANQAPGQIAGQIPGLKQVYYPPAPGSVPPQFTSQQVQGLPPPPSSNTAIFVQSSKAPKNPLPPAQSQRPAPKKSVIFSALQIRTYETILGDNPSCSTGPSLGLGWRYDPSHYISTIDEYERHQSQHGCADPRPEDLVLHRFEREAILLNTGYTRQDLAESVRGITKVKNRRRQTVHNLPVAWVEERMEGCRRTLRRWILNKNRTRSMYDEWKRQELANMDARPSSSCTRGILRKRRSG
jgi:hypothetical protein